MPNLVRDNSQPWERVEEPGRHFKGGPLTPCQPQVPVQESDAKKKEGPAEAGGREGLQRPASRTQFIRMWQREKAFCRHSSVNEWHNRDAKCSQNFAWVDRPRDALSGRKCQGPSSGSKNNCTSRRTEKGLDRRRTVETSIRHFSYYWEDKWKTNKSQEYKRLIKILNWF